MNPYHWVLDFRAILVFMLLLHHRFIEKKSGKRNLIRLISPSSFEIVFILLIKIIAVFMQILIIKFKKLILKRPLIRFSALMLF